MKLQWKNPQIEGYPPSGIEVFIKVDKYLQIAYWLDSFEIWYNTVYGQLPPVYDDEGTYPRKVTAWAEIPEDLKEEVYFK